MICEFCTIYFLIFVCFYSVCPFAMFAIIKADKFFPVACWLRFQATVRVIYPGTIEDVK